MKTYSLLFVITLLYLGLASNCSKDPKCSGEDKNLGIINSSILIACEPRISKQSFIIDNDSIFQQTFSDPLTGQLQCALPTIDFNSFTVLGLYADGQCEVKFIREVIQLQNENQYYYKVIVKECGACKKLDCSYNWVAVPKLPNGWSVIFETTKN
ncbi:MAG: hypothetical protein ABIJ04_07190 [Bacteroidota bacterium]